MRDRRYLMASLACFGAACLLMTCGATSPVTPTPSPGPPPNQPAALPVVTLTLELSVATVTLADAGSILCLVAPSDPYQGMPPGSVSRMCMPARLWLTWTGAK
jgi:hypothetical protein